MKLSVKIGIGAGALVALGGFVLVSAMGYVLYEGPRMRIQKNIRAFQAETPPLPAGVVPAAMPDMPASAQVPSVKDAAALVNPIPATDENRARGKVYYEYYCVFCHGEYGDGNGPVGQSYAPKPTDLRTAKIQAYSDGQLLRAMLAGEGHEPVLERVVPQDHRWRLVLYLRTLK